MHNITLDFSNPGLPQVIDVMQSDAQSRFIGLTLYDGGVPYSAPSGAVYTVEYRGQGANNTGWYDTIQLSSGTRKAVVVSSSSPNVVTLELAEQALRVNGKVEVSLCVVNNTGYKINTFPIICRVTGAPYVDPVAVRSYFYVTGLTSEQWLAYVTACQDAQKRAEDAAATFETDPTLTLSGKAADASITGKKIEAESARAIKIENNLGSNLEYHKQLIDVLDIKNDGKWAERSSPKKTRTLTGYNVTKDGVNIEDPLGKIEYYKAAPNTYYNIRCITGFTLAGIVWRDSEESVISTDAIIEYPASGKYEMISGYWKSPKNCASVKINGYKGKEPRIRERLFRNNNVYTTYEELPVTWNTEKWYNAPNKTYRNESVGLESCEIEVSKGEQYKICGFSNYEMQLYQLFSNNEMISIYPNTNSKPVYYEREITIPENVDKLIVNGFSDISDPSNPGFGNTVGKTKIYKISDTNIKQEKKNIIWAAIGDSLTDSATLNNKVTGVKNYVQYAAKAVDATATALGVGGTGYLADGKGYFHPYYYRVNQIPEDATVVTIFGSFNDIYLSDFSVGNLNEDNNSTLCGAFNFLIRKIYERAPNCTIGIITPTPWAEANRRNIESNLHDKAIAYVDALRNVAQYNSLPILNLFDESNLRPWEEDFNKKWFLNSDGTHPLSSAHEKFIAPKVADFLKKII